MSFSGIHRVSATLACLRRSARISSVSAAATQANVIACSHSDRAKTSALNGPRGGTCEKIPSRRSVQIQSSDRTYGGPVVQGSARLDLRRVVVAGQGQDRVHAPDARHDRCGKLLAACIVHSDRPQREQVKSPSSFGYGAASRSWPGGERRRGPEHSLLSAPHEEQFPLGLRSSDHLVAEVKDARRLKSADQV